MLVGLYPYLVIVSGLLIFLLDSSLDFIVLVYLVSSLVLVLLYIGLILVGHRANQELLELGSSCSVGCPVIRRDCILLSLCARLLRECRKSKKMKKHEILRYYSFRNRASILLAWA